MNARSRSLFLHHMAILCFQVLSWLWFEHWHSHVSYLPRLFEFKHITVNNLLIFLHFIHSSIYHSVWIVVNFYATMHQIHFFFFFSLNIFRVHTLNTFISIEWNEYWFVLNTNTNWFLLVQSTFLQLYFGCMSLSEPWPDACAQIIRSNVLSEEKTNLYCLWIVSSLQFVMKSRVICSKCAISFTREFNDLIIIILKAHLSKCQSGDKCVLFIHSLGETDILIECFNGLIAYDNYTELCHFMHAFFKCSLSPGGSGCMLMYKNVTAQFFVNVKFNDQNAFAHSDFDSMAG